MATNTNNPFGARAVSATGASFHGNQNLYYIPDTNAVPLAVGDFVISGGSADADGVPSVARAAAGNRVRGIITGFRYDRDRENLPDYLPANTAAYVYVLDDPNARIVMQEDSVGGALTAADVGLNASFVVSNPNATTGASQFVLDSSSAATTNTLPLKITELWQEERNTIGDYACWVLTFNTHELKTDTGSTGV